MKAKTFVCGKCKNEFVKVRNLQPVPTINFGGICQFCWCSITWGEQWAKSCRESDPRMQPAYIYASLRDSASAPPSAGK